MRRSYKIDYDEKRNCFLDIADAKSKLIYGDPEHIRNPFFSYVIPVYKRADLLEETLASVIGQRKVDFPWNILVVDNEAGGENETERLIRRLNHPRILYYRNSRNLGVAGNYNRCIELSVAPWVAMLHGDDLIMDDHLEEMDRLIGELSQNEVPLAYIYQRYIEFSDREKVRLQRSKLKGDSGLEQILLKDYGAPLRTTQSFGIFTGLFAALPSFGTVMNREIILAEGGFNEELGICEDVIIPFRLADRYGVYAATKIMGYYRLGRNESAKPETILKMYASMTDFREYMYTRRFWGQVWGWMARDILNRDLMNYFIGMSRNSERKVSEKELRQVREVRETKGLRLRLYQAVIWWFNRKYHLTDYDEKIAMLLKFQGENIQRLLPETDGILIYGAGHVARVLIPLIRKQHTRNILGCAITGQPKEREKVCGLEVRHIGDLKYERKKTLVITATEIWEYQDGMNKTLEQMGFDKVVNLL